MRSALAALLTCSSLHAITREVAITVDDRPAWIQGAAGIKE